GQHESHRAQAAGIEAVDERRRAALGHAVSLENAQPHGVEPLGDVPVERCGAGNEESDPAAKSLSYPAQHEAIRERVTQGQPGTRSSTVAPDRRELPSHVLGPMEEPLPERRFTAYGGGDAGVGFFEDARG